MNLEDLYLLKEDDFNLENVDKLISFYKEYQNKNFLFFLKTKKQWHQENPNAHFPGLCANINPITGKLRPQDEQRIWSWGDCRGLGIWSYFLITNRIPNSYKDNNTVINLKKEIADYSKLIHESIIDRYNKNDKTIPFTASIKTNLADDEPRNQKIKEDESDFNILFAISGLVQYGLYKGLYESINLGLQLLDRSMNAFENDKFIITYTKSETKFIVHGPRMICLGVVGEIIKSIQASEKQGITNYSNLKNKLIKTAITLASFILDNNYNSNNSTFWEQSTSPKVPLVANDGTVAVDPGHASEFSGFLAEIIPFINDDANDSKYSKQNFLDAALKINLFANKIGFSLKGAMYKSVDLITGNALPDTQSVAANGKATSPWWNVREHCASSLKLYTLTKNKELIPGYIKAQNASYTFFPNPKIDMQMIQMIDPDTLEWLDMPPATGNLDPMHDPRSRVREIENLELIKLELESK